MRTYTGGKGESSVKREAGRGMRAAAWLVMIVLLSLAPLWAASVGVKIDRTGLVLRDYNTWTGVLRLWKCEGWQSGNGTLTAWLNTCIARFEKQHKGVYIQLTDVSTETLSAFAGGAVNPPDMLVYAPGMLGAPYDLVQLPDELPIKDSLSNLGTWQGDRYAVPIALGGYAVAVNRSMLNEIPDDWSQAQLVQSDQKKETFVLDAPADGEFQSWSAAIISLFAGSYSQSAQMRQTLIGEGLEIGLPTAVPQNTPQVEQEETIYPNALPVSLPEDFRQRESIYSRFTSGEIAAMPVTQREIRRLQLLDESGKAPDWQVESIGLPFTDQAALFSITAWQRNDMQARQELCTEFMQLLLCEEMQTKLTQVRAFSVRDLPAMYQGNRGLSVIEAALSDENLLTPPAFGNEWRAYVCSLADEISAGESTQAAQKKLRAMLESGEAAR